jgi:hypothetical protein
MFIPGGFLSGTLFPWVLLAPLIMLFCIIIRKPSVDRKIIALSLLSTVTILADIFLFMSLSQPSLLLSFQSVAVFFQIIFSCLLLWTVSSDQYLQYAIAAASLVFAAIFLTMTASSGFEQFIPLLVKFGFALIFAFTILVLFSIQQNLSRHLNSIPGFWIAAGILFEFGVLTLLLIIDQNIRPGTIRTDNNLDSILLIISLVKHTFFCVGIWQNKKPLLGKSPRRI